MPLWLLRSCNSGSSVQCRCDNRVAAAHLRENRCRQRHSNMFQQNGGPDRRQWVNRASEFPAGMLGADAPAFETYGKGAGIERIECRHAINDDEPVNVELQLHQQLFTEGVDEVGGIGSAAHMADL